MTVAARSVLIVVAVVLGIGLVLVKVTRPPFTGDEPGYLIQAESLWRDLDLDLSNNVGSGTRLGEVTPDTRPETVLQVGDKLLPVQPPLLPLLLTPTVALAGSAGREVNLARFTIAGFAVATFALLLRTLTAMQPNSHGFAVLLMVAAATSLAGAPWIVAIYPEIVAGFCVAAGLHAVVTSYRGSMAAHGAAVAVLPWLSLRFLVVACLLLVLGLRKGRPRVAVTSASLGLSLVSLAVYSKITYGMWNPASVYDVFTGGYRPSLVTRYRVGVGSLFSRSEGLFVVLPLSWLALFGIGRVLRRHLLELGACASLTAIYLLAVLPSGARGTSPPPRLVVALVPLVLVGVWMGFSEHRGWLICLIAASLLGIASSVPYLRGSNAILPLFGDSEAIRLSGQIPIYPRMHAALGTEGPSRLPAQTAISTGGNPSTATWGPFQVVGGEWMVWSADGSGLPDGLVVSWASTSQGPYRPVGQQRPDSPSSLSFVVPGYESWLRAAGPQPSAASLDFRATRPRSRERVVLSEAWKSALLICLGAAVIGAGCLSSARADDQR